MQVVVTAWNRDKKILAIKGVRAVSGSGLKEAKEFVEGPLPRALPVRPDLSLDTVKDILAANGVYYRALFDPHSLSPDEWILGERVERALNIPGAATERYVYGAKESAAQVIARLHAAVEHLRDCEMAGKMGADDQLVLDALYSYEAFVRVGRGIHALSPSPGTS